MKLADALKRIEQLEAKVRALEARPVQHIHHHHAPNPLQYQPLQPVQNYPWTVCGNIGAAAWPPFTIDPEKSMVWRNPAPDAARGIGPLNSFRVGPNA